MTVSRTLKTTGDNAWWWGFGLTTFFTLDVGFASLTRAWFPLEVGFASLTPTKPSAERGWLLAALAARWSLAIEFASLTRALLPALGCASLGNGIAAVGLVRSRYTCNGSRCYDLEHGGHHRFPSFSAGYQRNM